MIDNVSFLVYFHFSGYAIIQLPDMILSFHRLVNKTKANQNSPRVFEARTGIEKADHLVNDDATPTKNQDDLLKILETKQLKMFEQYKKEFMKELKPPS